VIAHGLAFIVLTFGFLGGWVAFAPLSGAVIAEGVVKVESNRKTVQHLEGGIVRDILVKEGDEVALGQPLIVLENEHTVAELNILRDQLDAETVREARYLAEKSRSSSIALPASLLERRADEKLAEIIMSETRVFTTQREVLEGQIKIIQNQIAEVKDEIGALERQIASSRQTTRYLDEELASNARLAEKGFVAQQHILELRRALSAEDTRRGEYSAEVARAKQKIAELQLHAIGLTDQYQQQSSEGLKKSQEQIFDLQERLRVPEDTIKRQTIAAPVAGRIVDLKVHTAGGVIAPREPLMDIVPQGTALIIQCKVQVQDIDEIHPGQTADIHLTAYKQRTTSLVEGVVIYVSADRLEAENAYDQPHYLAHVRVEAEALEKAGENISLYPGMPAEVYLKTQERTALRYLLDPLLNTLRRAGRET
ncbi:MAG TPA: HlyD family type I secretion periplasmic adaptor subunit, partial [Methylococcaceae bacterium]|nr:HlyD family type I secretion periplasmic adaptor subunit [Methylococcaceae bacterium]